MIVIENSPTEPGRRGPPKDQQGPDPEEGGGKSRALESGGAGLGPRTVPAVSIYSHRAFLDLVALALWVVNYTRCPSIPITPPRADYGVNIQGLQNCIYFFHQSHKKMSLLS